MQYQDSPNHPLQQVLVLLPWQKVYLPITRGVWLSQCRTADVVWTGNPEICLTWFYSQCSTVFPPPPLTLSKRLLAECARLSTRHVCRRRPRWSSTWCGTTSPSWRATCSCYPSTTRWTWLPTCPICSTWWLCWWPLGHCPCGPPPTAWSSTSSTHSVPARSSTSAVSFHIKWLGADMGECFILRVVWTFFGSFQRKQSRSWGWAWPNSPCPSSTCCSASARSSRPPSLPSAPATGTAPSRQAPTRGKHSPCPPWKPSPRPYWRSWRSEDLFYWTKY